MLINSFLVPSQFPFHLGKAIRNCLVFNLKSILLLFTVAPVLLLRFFIQHPKNSL